MHPVRKRRLWLSLLITLSTLVAGLLVVYALRENIDLYLTPQKIQAMNRLPKGHVTLGGLVKSGSLCQKRQLTHRFKLIGGGGAVSVQYQGALPVLFGEGKGAVVEGHFSSGGLFIADRVLAKHDADYHPPANP